MKLKNYLMKHAMQITSMFALASAFATYDRYCCTFLYEPKMPQAMIDMAADK